MLSTRHKGSSSHMTLVNSKWPNKPPIKKTDAVIDYLKHMGGVDRSDHFVSSYQFMRRTRKWYRKMFFWLLEVAIINSFLLFQEVQTAAGNRNPLTHAQFQKKLVTSLTSEKARARLVPARKRGRPAQVGVNWFITDMKYVDYHVYSTFEHNVSIEFF